MVPRRTAIKIPIGRPIKIGVEANHKRADLSGNIMVAISETAITKSSFFYKEPNFG